jgi:hypothetical protein
MRVWAERIAFKTALLQDNEVMQHLGQQDLEQIFGMQNRWEKIDYIFKKVGLEP